MADSLNTTNLSRRSMLGTGIAAAGVFATCGAAQASAPDAELARLFAAYVSADKADMDAYHALEEAEVEGKPSVKALKRASKRAEEARYRLWDELAETPSKSVRGLAIKLAAMLQFDPNLQSMWNGSVDCDITGQMFLAVRDDALRLAGLPESYGTESIPTGEA